MAAMIADEIRLHQQVKPRSRHCNHCGGEGKLYTSRYGGNDPDVWPTGECEACEGQGTVDICATCNDRGWVDESLGAAPEAHSGFVECPDCKNPEGRPEP